MKRVVALSALLAGSAFAVAAPERPTWCLGLSALGPMRAGMTAEQAIALADFSGLERNKPAGDCWYLNYDGGGADFRLMIIGGKVVRLELTGDSRLDTISGAHIGSTESELKDLYGARLDVQPHKYDEAGHVITYRSADGDYGLRFETSHGKVTAIQAGPWEHLNYVEGCG